jgi:hypothetical protein
LLFGDDLKAGSVDAAFALACTELREVLRSIRSRSKVLLKNWRTACCALRPLARLHVKRLVAVEADQDGRSGLDRDVRPVALRQDAASRQEVRTQLNALTPVCPGRHLRRLLLHDQEFLDDARALVTSAKCQLHQRCSCPAARPRADQDRSRRAQPSKRTDTPQGLPFFSLVACRPPVPRCR